MSIPSFLKINIRQKVIIGITLFFLAIGGMTYLSYSYLMEVEQKVALVEIADDLSNIVLEIRRTEKNVLLYGDETNMLENRRYIQKALLLLENFSVPLNLPSVKKELSDLKGYIWDYADTIKEIPSRQRECRDLSQCQGLLDTLRERGQLIMQKAREISKYERGDILRINKQLRRNLLYSMALFFAIGLGLFLFVTFNIVQPLRVIEATTSSIAKGNFKPMPVWNTNDEIQRVIEALNRMVGELDRRRDQLVQSQKLSSLGTLTSGIAHQLNNPLNNISTSCQILMEEQDKNTRFSTKMLSNIDQETLRARDIVKGLLEFSRHQEFSPAVTPLSQVVNRAVRLTSSQVPSGIEIKEEISGDLSVFIDFQRMQEALINLILNAVQAIDKPPGTVTISAQAAPDNESVLLTI
ncbi:MAG: HAMP domain-containing sensor histidine kinase, partial [Thermodesulfobacteriota bacterium]|nr:HAMP domain-containing sensor histidine kinase [Thermodesulfobacteriota bacterium]